MRLCTIPDCAKPYYAKGRCRRHYEQWRDTTDEKPRCTIDGCTKPVKARGWCATHYRQWLRGDTPYPIATQRPECAVDGCTATAVCRAMCGRHYQRWRRLGSTDLPPRREPAPKPKAAPKRKRKPADGMPAGWHKPTPRSSERIATNPVERVDTLLPLESTSMAIVRQHAPAVRRILARHNALDLAEMLGVSS